MILSVENYHSKEANQEYLSVSQYKDFCGSLGKVPCEAQALAKLSGEWITDKTTALLVGSYVDAHFEESLGLFKASNSEIFTKSGDLKADYRNAENVICRIERDAYMMQYLSGQKQVIMTGEIAGAKVKIKIDSYLPGQAIVDLKVMKAIKDTFWVRDTGYMDFVQYWGYDIQGAVYQEIVRQNTGEKLPFFIAAASKEKEPDINVIFIDDLHLKEKLIEVESNVAKIFALKNGDYEPIRCEVCDYCKHTKVLTKAIHFSELMGDL